MIRPLHIRHIRVDPPLLLAPMAGYTSSPLRLLARASGCGFVFSEVIAVKGLLHGGRKTAELMAFTDAERPIGIQLLGGVPEEIARAVPIVEDAAPDAIDINLGCPKPKITAKGEGGALLEEPDRAVAVVRAAVRATSLPVTAKLRLPSWFTDSSFAAFCRQLIDAGAAALTIHPRRVADGFRGHARWGVLEDLASRLPAPVLASGDIRTPEDARRLLGAGLGGVMIGRAAVGNPGIFRQIAAALAGQEGPPSTLPERVTLCLRHLELLRAEKGDLRAVCELRKQLSRYLRGLPHLHDVTRRLITLTDAEAVRAELEELFGQLTS